MKKRRSVNRLLTMLLAIVMVIGLLPAGLKVQAGMTGSGTEEDPLVVRTFAQLQNAMKLQYPVYVRVDEFENSEGKDYYELLGDAQHALYVDSACTMYLELNTVIDVRTENENMDSFIKNTGKLTIYGNGGIVFSNKSKSDRACVINNTDHGNLTVWGNVSIEGKNDEPGGKCLAVVTDGDGWNHTLYCITDLRGGRFKGVGPACAFYKNKDFSDSKATISGGVFESSTEGCPALYIGKEANLKISGGTFWGIETEAGGKNSDLTRYIADDFAYLTNGGEVVSGSGLTKLEGEVGIDGNIPGADISIDIPRPGNKGADPVITTEDVALWSGSVEWERYDGDTRVPMGAEEKFVTGEKYRVTFTVIPAKGCGRYFYNPFLIYVNGIPISKDDKVGDFDNYTIHCDYTVPPVYIGKVNVNVEVPKEGDTPKDAVSATEHINVTDTKWYLEEITSENAQEWHELQPTDVFEPAAYYKVSVTVVEDEGYQISTWADELINEDIYTRVTGKNKTERQYSKIFRVPGIIIDPVDFAVTEPVDGEIMAAEVVSTTEHVTVEGATWVKLDGTYDKNTFTEGEEYILRVWVKADPGYDFAAEPLIRFNSKTPGHPYGSGAESMEVHALFTAGPAKVRDGLSVSFTNGSSFTYTGSKITPPVEVKYNGKVLSEGVDYTVKYKNNIKASEGAAKQPTVIVTGKTFAATGSNTFTITKKNIADADVIAEGLTVAAGKTAAPALYYGGKKLGKSDFNNPDAKVTFSADGNITVEGKGNFCGTRTIPVHVGEAKKISVTAFTPAERVYNMVAQPLTAAELTVMSGSTALTEGVDYAISYPADCAGAGTLKLAVVGIGEYSGSVSKSMKIAPCTSGVSVDVPASVEFNPGGARPDVDVYTGLYKLSCGRDYSLKFSNNKAVTGAKKASVTVKFSGNYKGCASVTKEFDITPYDLSAHSVRLYAEDMIYTKPGKYRKTPYVEVNGKLLSTKDMDLGYAVDGKALADGTLINDDLMQAGKLVITVSATGKGNYTGTISDSFTLSKADKAQDLSKAKLSVEKKKYEFCAAPIVPNVTVKMGNDTLVMDQDYTVSCVLNVNKGKGICIITGLGDAGTGTKKYYGSKVVKFSIVKGKLNWM